MKRMQQGYTMIELMVVVAIIAVLSAIAIPQYQAYHIRAQVGRVIAETGQLKVMVEDCLNNGVTGTLQNWSFVPNKDAINTTGCALSGINSADKDPIHSDLIDTSTNPLYVEVQTGGATIRATLGNRVSAKVRGKQVIWQRHNNGAWTCSTAYFEDVPEYVPASCAPAAVTTPPTTNP